MDLKKIGSSMIKYLMLIFISNIAFAQDVQIKFEPERPVKQSPFKMLFIIDVLVDEVPIVNFNPVAVEVLGRQLLGVAKRSSFINGKLTNKTQYTISYDLLANNSGMGRIEDIEVITGGKKISIQDKNFQILASNPVANDHFVIAIPSKREVFVGESVMLDYFIYTRTQTANHEIRKFPVLKNFIKRFIQKPDITERIEYNGRVYNRRLLYSVQLFPEKAGDLKIDSLSLRYQYAVVDQNSGSFGNFGFGFRSLRSTTASSDQLTLKVNPVPSNAPATFTGLVGNHEVHLNFNKTKFLVNDPIELKFEISGKGALENFEAPQFLKSDKVEQFETSGDLKISTEEKANKIFEYTYLPKSPMTMPAREFVLSFLDPNSGDYINKKISLPEIIIGGSAAAAPRSFDQLAGGKMTNNESSALKSPSLNEVPMVWQIVAPIEESRVVHRLPLLITFVLIFVTALLWGYVLKRDYSYLLNRRGDAYQAIKYLKSNKSLRYAHLRAAFVLVDKNFESKTFEDYFNRDCFNATSRKYIEELVTVLEKNEYQSSAGNLGVKVDYKKLYAVFNEVLTNANNKQSGPDII